MPSDLDVCRGLLPSVSRTFALAIPALPEPLADEVTVAYLVCRAADTIEDRPDLPDETRRAAFAAFERQHRALSAPLLQIHRAGQRARAVGPRARAAQNGGVRYRLRRHGAPNHPAAERIVERLAV